MIDKKLPSFESSKYQRYSNYLLRNVYFSDLHLQEGFYGSEENHTREQRRQHAERQQGHFRHEPPVRPEPGQPRQAAEPEQEKVGISVFFKGNLSTFRQIAAYLS